MLRNAGMNNYYGLFSEALKLLKVLIIWLGISGMLFQFLLEA